MSGRRPSGARVYVEPEKDKIHVLSQRMPSSPKEIARRPGGGGGGRPKGLTINTATPSSTAGGAQNTGTNTWQPVSPTTRTALLRELDAGSPYARRIRKTDPRQTILRRMTYLNLFLGAVMLILYGAGPAYPGHQGTLAWMLAGGGGGGVRSRDLANSPIYADSCATSEMAEANRSILHSALIVGLVIWVLQPVAAFSIRGKTVGHGGALCTLLSSSVSAITCAFAFLVVLLDMEYITDCCTDLQLYCELTDLCTDIVDTCCAGPNVVEYCGDPRYRYAGAIMIFIVFVTTFTQVIMALTIGCRCWLDADPEKQELMMVVASSPRGTHAAHTPPPYTPSDSPMQGERLQKTPGTSSPFSSKLGGKPSSPTTPARAPPPVPQWSRLEAVTGPGVASTVSLQSSVGTDVHSSGIEGGIPQIGGAEGGGMVASATQAPVEKRRRGSVYNAMGPL